MKVLRVIALVGVLLMLSSKPLQRSLIQCSDTQRSLIQRNDTQRSHIQRRHIQRTLQSYNDLDDNQRVEMYFLTED